jgi:MFS family permease
MRNPIAAYMKSYPLRDRVTFWHDSRSGLLYGVFNGMAIPFIGVVGRKLGMDSTQLALLSSSVFLGLLVNLWLGHLSDKGDKAAWVLWPGVASRAAAGLAGLAVSPTAFLWAMGSYNVISTFMMPAYSSLMRSNYSDGQRAKAMGHIRVAMMVVSALFAALAGWAMDAAPWAFRIVFPAAGLAGIASSLVFFKVKARPAPPDPAEKPEGAGFLGSLRILKGDKRFLLFLGIFFIVGMPDKIVVSLEPIRLVDELGVSYGSAGVLLGTIPLIASILGYLILSRISKKADPFYLLVLTVLFASSRYLNIALASSPYQLIPGSILSGVANAGWDLLPLFVMITFAHRSRLSLYMGAHNTLVGLRGLLGPLLGTWLYQGLHVKISSLYIVSFCIALAGSALLLAFRMTTGKRGPT